MTENEAINYLRQIDPKHIECVELIDMKEVWDNIPQAVSVAEKALTEIQQYQAIGTVKECREAMERQIAKKPLKGEPFTWVDSVKVRGRYRDVRKTSHSHVCPNCGRNVAMDMNCCKYCGQSIDWSDTD